MLTHEETLAKQIALLTDKLEIAEKANRIMDIELNLVHDCLTQLYNGHDTNVPIIKECLAEIKKITL